MAINPLHLICLEPSAITQEPVRHRYEFPVTVAAPAPLDDPYVADLARISRSLRQASQAREKAIGLAHQLLRACDANARAVRLDGASSSVRRTLTECLKAEDKHSFLTLFNAYHDLSEQFYGIKRSPDYLRSSQSFLDQLPVASREAVLTLLYRVHSDGEFVAGRLASLSQKEIQSLYMERTTNRPGESIINAVPSSSSRPPRHLGYAVDVQTETLSSREHASPLRTMIGVAYGANHDLALHTWSSICARLVQDKRQGSEKIVPAIMDVWASASPWSGQDRFEQWLLRTIQDGAFLADQPSKLSFRVRVQGWPEPTTEDGDRAETFYNAAVASLLDILGDTAGASVIPESVLEICKAVWSMLDSSPGHQRMFPQFIVTRWLFSSFLFDAIISPEAFGMLDSHFVSDNVRQHVLREIALRTQKAVLDVIYSWRHGSAGGAHEPQRVQRVIERFQTAEAVPITPLVDESLICAVSAKEVVSLINALYPQQRPASIMSRSDAAQSSASSVSSFSLFSNVGPDFPRIPSTLVGHGSCSTATVNSQSTTPINADRSEALDLEKLALWSDHEQLREACALLEDLSMSQMSDEFSPFAVLNLHPDGGKLCTMSDRLQAGPPNTSERRDLRKLVAAVETALIRCPESTLSIHAGFESILVSVFEDITSQAEKTAALLEAHEWSARLDDMLSLPAEYPLSHLLRRIEERAIRSLQTAVQAAEVSERLLQDIRPALDRSVAALARRVGECQSLRIKMWYVTDVRNSAPYDEVRSVTTALKTMAKSRRPIKPKASPPALRHWGTTRLANSNLHFKIEDQVLDLIGAPREQGGPNKLTDDQARLVRLWLDSNGIENLCRGEERIHKFCMEVRKCAKQMTAEDAPMWSSPMFADHWPPLYKREELHSPSRLDRPAFHITPKSSAGLSSHRGRAFSNASSRDDTGHRSPALTSRSSAPFWSCMSTEAETASSATSFGSTLPQAHLNYGTKFVATDSHASPKLLERRLISMLVSDLGLSLFADGSETDANVFAGFGGELTALYLNGQQAKGHCDAKKSRFDYHAAFMTLLNQFASLVDPFAKLAVLNDLNRLIAAFVVRGSGQKDRHALHGTTSNATIDQFMVLFSDRSVRPAAIFRDMQYIASLVPDGLSVDTAAGEAFHNAALALLRLKGELMNHFVTVADGIIQYHTNNRAHGRASSHAQEQRDSATFLPNNRTPLAEDVARYSMTEAAFLLQVTAKEGIAAAQRELGTLYLTHPELMDHVMSPLARPREVFTEELESKWRKNQDPTRCDPATMCVAHHWMSLASRGGDALAQEYLRQREEMERLP